MSKTTTFEEEINKHGYLIYTNVGDSMLPMIREGADLLYIEKCDRKLKKYDIPLYRRDNGQYVLHRIIKVRADDYLICGDNRWHIESGIKDTHIIGVLTKIIRNGREITFDTPGYKTYVFFWCKLFPIRAGILWSRDMIKRLVRYCFG